MKVLQKRDLITDAFLRNVSTLQNIIFTFAEDRGMTASDFQLLYHLLYQHKVNSITANCLGLPEAATGSENVYR